MNVWLIGSYKRLEPAMVKDTHLCCLRRVGSVPRPPSPKNSLLLLLFLLPLFLFCLICLICLYYLLLLFLHPRDPCHRMLLHSVVRKMQVFALLDYSSNHPKSSLLPLPDLGKPCIRHYSPQGIGRREREWCYDYISDYVIMWIVQCNVVRLAWIVCY